MEMRVYDSGSLPLPEQKWGKFSLNRVGPRGSVSVLLIHGGAFLQFKKEWIDVRCLT